MNVKEFLMKGLGEMEKRHPDMTPEIRAEVMAQLLARAKYLCEKKSAADLEKLEQEQIKTYGYCLSDE